MLWIRPSCHDMIPWTQIKSAYFISCTETDPVDDRNVQAIECFSFALKILSTLLANLSTSSFFCNRCKFINVGLENLFIDIKFPCRFLFRFFQVPQNSIFTNISLLDIDVGPRRATVISKYNQWTMVKGSFTFHISSCITCLFHTNNMSLLFQFHLSAITPYLTVDFHWTLINKSTAMHR